MTFPPLSLKHSMVWPPRAMCGVSHTACLPSGRGDGACGWEDKSMGACPDIGSPKLGCRKVRVTLWVFENKAVYSSTPCRHRNRLGMWEFEDRRMAWDLLSVFTALCWMLLWMQLSLSLLLVHSSPRNQHVVPAWAHSTTQRTTPFASSVS